MRFALRPATAVTAPSVFGSLLLKTPANATRVKPSSELKFNLKSYSSGSSRSTDSPPFAGKETANATTSSDIKARLNMVPRIIAATDLAELVRPSDLTRLQKVYSFKQEGAFTVFDATKFIKENADSPPLASQWMLGVVSARSNLRKVVGPHPYERYGLKVHLVQPPCVTGIQSRDSILAAADCVIGAIGLPVFEDHLQFTRWLSTNGPSVIPVLDGTAKLDDTLTKMQEWSPGKEIEVGSLVLIRFSTKLPSAQAQPFLTLVPEQVIILSEPYYRFDDASSSAGVADF